MKFGRVARYLFDDTLPDKAFRLLCFLIWQSNDQDAVQVNYAAMMHNTSASKDSIWRCLKLLRKSGWIYTIRRNGSSPSVITLQIPAKFTGMDVQYKPGKVVYFSQSAVR